MKQYIVLQSTPSEVSKAWIFQVRFSAKVAARGRHILPLSLLSWQFSSPPLNGMMPFQILLGSFATSPHPARFETTLTFTNFIVSVWCLVSIYWFIAFLAFDAMELQHLPNEVKILIFSLLDPNERLSVARTCRNLSDIIEPIMYTSFVVCFSRHFLCFGRRFVALEHILPLLQTWSDSYRSIATPGISSQWCTNGFNLQVGIQPRFYPTSSH